MYPKTMIKPLNFLSSVLREENRKSNNTGSFSCPGYVGNRIIVMTQISSSEYGETESRHNDQGKNTWVIVPNHV